jgi:hypothetical protein
MIGKASPPGDNRSCVLEAGEEFLRPADPGEGIDGLPGDGGRIGGGQKCRQDRAAAGDETRDAGAILADQHHGLGAPQGRRERLAQGPGGKDMTVAEPALAIDRQGKPDPWQGRDLNPSSRMMARRHPPRLPWRRRPIARDPGGRASRQQQRFVADSLAPGAGINASGPASLPP